MRAVALLAAACAIAAPRLAAQHGHQFEFGAYGSYTRYDRAFVLSNQFGGGARLGYFFGNVVAAELDVGYQSPNPAHLAVGSGSLVLNFGSSRNLFYILGGYSRLDFEPSAPYRFTDNGVHGALGDRIFLGDHVALRLEARAIYSPSTNAPFGPSWAGHIVGSMGLSLFTSSTPRDLDKDGVPDNHDACPGTPLGAIVDTRGCPIDSDHDGVYDGLDKCPGTPGGAIVDANGCPMDSDKDGVYDGLDKCPGTPAGATVDANGCPMDSDKDGVYDGLDKCPNTPPGTEVDASGCQLAKDSDGDGVDDSKDKCPGTPPGTKVDALGCAILFTSERAPLVLKGVTFETGRSALKPESYVVLDEVAASLNANVDIRIEIAGYTDNTGTARGNLVLSQSRAGAVRAYLASKGVSPDRMVSKGYGVANPIATNTTAAGRAQNRRVELHRLP